MLASAYFFHVAGLQVFASYITIKEVKLIMIVKTNTYTQLETFKYDENFGRFKILRQPKKSLVSSQVSLKIYLEMVGIEQQLPLLRTFIVRRIQRINLQNFLVQRTESKYTLMGISHC